MKITANTTVMIIPNSVPRRLPSINEWCAYVTLAPDDRSRIVFSNGISNGFNGSIPAGGQAFPNSTVGAKAEWKSIYSHDVCLYQSYSQTISYESISLKHVVFELVITASQGFRFIE